MRDKYTADIDAKNNISPALCVDHREKDARAPMLMNVIIFEAIWAFISGSSCIRSPRFRSGGSDWPCKEMQGMPTLVTSASSGAWMRKRKIREPLSGELNNAQASTYWTQFANAHCATTQQSNGVEWSIDLTAGPIDR